MQRQLTLHYNRERRKVYTEIGREQMKMIHM